MKSKLKTFIVSLSLQVHPTFNTFAFYTHEVLFWDLTLDKKKNENYIISLSQKSFDLEAFVLFI